MHTKQSIINIKGKIWKHRLLNRIANTKEFPTRLRIFNILKKVFRLDLLLFHTPSGLKLLMDISDWVQYQIYFYGSYEAESLVLFKKLSQTASVIFDIGAHIGQYGLECAKADVSQTKQIFAIEVNPKTFTYLLNNIQMNGFKAITPVLGAISASHDILNINIPAYWNMGNTQIDESSKGLDNYLAASFDIIRLLKTRNIDHIDLIKIDIEGHEFTVLEKLFTSGINPSNILFEFIPDVFSQSLSLIELLHLHNYTIKDINGNLYTGQKIIPEQNLWAEKIVKDF